MDIKTSRCLRKEPGGQQNSLGLAWLLVTLKELWWEVLLKCVKLKVGVKEHDFGKSLRGNTQSKRKKQSDPNSHCRGRERSFLTEKMGKEQACNRKEGPGGCLLVVLPAVGRGLGPLQ